MLKGLVARLPFGRKRGGTLASSATHSLSRTRRSIFFWCHILFHFVTSPLLVQLTSFVFGSNWVKLAHSLSGWLA